VTSKRGGFALGDMDHQQNRGEFRALYSYGKLAQVKILITHVSTLSFKPQKGTKGTKEQKWIFVFVPF
jgi:hypothetical protein